MIVLSALPNPWDDFLKTFVDTKNIIGILLGATFTMFAFVVALLVPDSQEFGLLGGKLIIYILLVTFVLFLASLASLMRLPDPAYAERLNPKEYLPLLKLAFYSLMLGEALMVAVLALTAYIFIDYLATVIVVILMVILELLLFKITKKDEEFNLFSSVRALSSSFVNITLLICISLDFFEIILWRSIPF